MAAHQSRTHQRLSAVVVIPARMESSRFPGKVLANRTGKPLIQHVYERAVQARSIQRVIVAADDERIRCAVEAFGGRCIMTRRDHPNGTSRIAEAASHLAEPIVVNVQGDEPEIDPQIIDRGVQALVEHPECPVATLASPLTSMEDAANPNIVKVVVNQRSQAMYFSRALIPFDRDGERRVQALRHVGLYVYRREFLPRYVELPATPLEQIEKLEQLRILEHGFSIAVALCPSEHHGIDTPEQYESFVQRQMSRERDER